MEFFESVAEKIAAGTERGKQLGKQVLKQASTAAQTVRRQVTATAQAAKDRAVQAARTAQAEVVQAARAVQTKAVQTARDVADTTRAGAGWIKDKAGQVADWSKKKAQQAAHAVGEGAKKVKGKIKEAIAAVKGKAKEAVAWAKDKANGVIDGAVGGLIAGLAGAATANETVEKCIENALRKKNRVDNPQDGQYMGNDCPNSSIKAPTTGRLPEGCGGSGGKLPKIIYTNGIITPPEAACATMHKIANERCAEVIGVYNATYGFLEDALDARDSIDRSGRQPAAESQAALMTQMLNEKPPQRVTVYAHSEGGLITQEGLIETQEKLQQERYNDLTEQGMGSAQAKEESKRAARESMGNVDVYSFGTAERDWPPTGAKLHQFTNTSDMVPRLIDSVQQNRGVDNEPVDLAERHRFTRNFTNPINAHNMDNTYLTELNRVKPVPKKANGRCC